MPVVLVETCRCLRDFVSDHGWVQCKGGCRLVHRGWVIAVVLTVDFLRFSPCPIMACPVPSRTYINRLRYIG